MAENGVGHLPALAAGADDLLLGHPHVGEEDLVEVGRAGHIDQWPDFDAGGVHAEQQEGDALVLGGIRLGAHQAEDPIRQMGGAGPDLLSIDHPLVAVEHRRGAQAGQVAARARLRIALAPDHLAVDGGLDEGLPLLIGPHFKQRRHQHGDALPA